MVIHPRAPLLLSTSLNHSQQLAHAAKFKKNVHNWGALDPFPKGSRNGGAWVSQEGSRCLLQLPQLGEVGLGHLNPQGSGGCGARRPQRVPGWDVPSPQRWARSQDLAARLFLQEPLPGETRQAAGGDRGPAWSHHRPSVRPAALGGGTTRGGAPPLLVRVEPTRLVINPLTAENKPPVLAVHWAGDEAVTGHPVPSTPQGGEKRETVSECHLRKIPPEFLAASFTSVAANATGSPETCRCRTLPSGLDVSTGLLSSSPPHNSPSQCPQKQRSPLRSV